MQYPEKHFHIIGTFGGGWGGYVAKPQKTWLKLVGFLPKAANYNKYKFYCILHHKIAKQTCEVRQNRIIMTHKVRKSRNTALF